MKILLVHSRYRERGGEDKVFDQEKVLLDKAGVVVESLEFNNDDIREERLIDRVRLGLATTWSISGWRAVKAALEARKPDIVHFHNTFPQLSPSVYYACKSVGVPVVQTIHNYRLLCSAGTFLREDRVCEECLPRRFYNGVRFRCYRDSLAASFAVSTMQYVHHSMGSYRYRVDRYIALTRFAKEKLVEAGLPEDRIVIKSNTLADVPRVGKGGSEVVFVGRLSPEKGVDVLLRAWSSRRLQYPLRIIGDGPMRGLVEQAVRRSDWIRYSGQLSSDECQEAMGRARVLVLPSVWYEGFPMTVLESYAKGTPVIASRIGSLTELVRENETGWTFPKGDSEALSAIVEIAMNGGERVSTIRERCRDEFLERYSPEKNVAQLIDIYKDLISERGG